MAEVTIGSNLGSSLNDLLMCDQIVPGSELSYQICKAIWLFHPLGEKIAGWPIAMAQSQAREISVANSPGDHAKDAFLASWSEVGADDIIMNAHTIARAYGASAIVCGQAKIKNTSALNTSKLAEGDIYFNVYDPLNVAGSLVLDLNPNSPDFLKKLGKLTVNGEDYHSSRCCVIFNEKPVYLAYTSSSYGYVGRSAYQRILYPLKTFVQSMKTDDNVTYKAGVIIAKMKQPGSIINAIMQSAAAIKRTFVQVAATGNVISISTDEDIHAIDMTNTHTAMETARKNVLDNIATGAPMPAKVLNSETFAEGFGEGTEDAKDIARWVDGVRRSMGPTYAYMDKIVQHRAWDEAFFERMKRLFPAEYGKMDYPTFFTSLRNSFAAEWPSLLKAPPEKEAEVEKVKLEAIIALLEVLLPEVDPTSKAMLIQSALDNMNAQHLLFPTEFSIDYDALVDFLLNRQAKEDLSIDPESKGLDRVSPPRPFKALSG